MEDLKIDIMNISEIRCLEASGYYTEGHIKEQQLNQKIVKRCGEFLLILL